MQCRKCDGPMNLKDHGGNIGEGPSISCDVTCPACGHKQLYLFQDDKLVDMPNARDQWKVIAIIILVLIALGAIAMRITY